MDGVLTRWTSSPLPFWTPISSRCDDIRKAYSGLSGSTSTPRQSPRSALTPRSIVSDSSGGGSGANECGPRLWAVFEGPLDAGSNSSFDMNPVTRSPFSCHGVGRKSNDPKECETFGYTPLVVVMLRASFAEAVPGQKEAVDNRRLVNQWQIRPGMGANYYENRGGPGTGTTVSVCTGCS